MPATILCLNTNLNLFLHDLWEEPLPDRSALVIQKTRIEIEDLCHSRGSLARHQITDQSSKTMELRIEEVIDIHLTPEEQCFKGDVSVALAIRGSWISTTLENLTRSRTHRRRSICRVFLFSHFHDIEVLLLPNSFIIRSHFRLNAGKYNQFDIERGSLMKYVLLVDISMNSYIFIICMT